MTDFPRLIEFAFPLKQASLDSVHEKNVRHGHISTLHIWPARRPLAACRAALIATLLPDPSSEPKPEGMSEAEWQKEIQRRRQQLCEKIGGKVVKKIERKRMPGGQTVEREKEETVGGILHWGRETENADLPAATHAAQAGTLEWFRQEIRKAYGGRAPKVLDPFAGGGAIPLEAMRLGCEVTAIDINPVAWFILKCTLEYPQKLAGKTLPLPEFILENEEFMNAFYKAHPHLVGQGKKTRKQKAQEKMALFAAPDTQHAPKADLAWHVRAWGQWVLERARRELARFYPVYADFLPASGLRPSVQTSLPAHLPINRGAGFFVYVLRCSDGSFYIGQTENLDRRFRQHVEGEVSWTASRGPLELVHWEEFSSRDEAVKREQELKTEFGRKWLKQEFDGHRLRVQLYERRVVPLTEDGKPDIDRLNREFVDPFLSAHEWGGPKSGPACAERSEACLPLAQAGRWIAKPTVAYLWARTVTCKNCRATIPLLKTRWLCKKDKKRVLLTMEPNADKSGVVFGVETNVPINGANAAAKREHDKRIGAGTMSRAGAKCPCCGTINTMEDIRLEGRAGRLGTMATAVVVDGPNGKEYRLPTEHELRCAEQAAEHVERVFADVPFGLPTERIAAADALGMRVPLYGITRWCDLFTPRQLVALGTFVRHVRSSRATMHHMGYSVEWLEALAAYLAILVDKVVDRSSCQCIWICTNAEKASGSFGRFALQITWDFAEITPWSDAAGGYLGMLELLSECVSHGLYAAGRVPPHALRQSAIVQSAQEQDVIVTDPPYYDAIPYSDLMDFFYVWLRRSLWGLSHEIESVFFEPLSPKWDHQANDGELVDDASRHGNDETKSKNTYETGMARAFCACAKALKASGQLVIVFANKQPDAWETLVSALIRAGFTADGSWPIQTERAGRIRAQASAALASSVWLVCKKRPISARPGWDNNVLEEMRANITARLRDFWDAGIRGPDFVWAATGPALEAYSKHPVVKKADDPGQILTVSEFLSHVRRMVVDFVVGRVLAQDGDDGALAAADRLDEPTAYYLLHRHDFGLDEAPVGACILYATACGLSDQGLVRDWDLLIKTGGDQAAAEDEADEETDADEEPAEDTGSGSKVKLKAWNQRRGRSMGYEAPGGRPVPLIDRIHRLMHLWKTGDVHKVDEYLDEHGLRRHELFRRVLQSLIELSKPGSEERSLLESLSNHIGAKGATRKEAQRSFAFDQET